MTTIMQLLIHIRGGVSLVMSSVLVVGRYFRLGIILALACLACIFSCSPAVLQTQLPNPIKIGVRTSAYEIGNTVSINQAGGFCGIFGEELKQELANDKQIKIEYYEIKNDGRGHKHPRYDGLKTGKIHIECGPNSKPSQNMKTAEGITFSEAFHKTGVKLLLPQSLADDLNSEPQKLQNIKIGVVKETTTSHLLPGIVNKNNIKEYDTRDEALDDLDAKKIEAFASDALILKTILDRGIPSREPYIQKGFTLFKKDGYLSLDSRQEYVMAVKEKSTFSKKLIDSINRTLKRDKIAQAKEELNQIENPPIIPPPISLFTLIITLWLPIISGVFTELLGVFITVISTTIRPQNQRLFLLVLGVALCVLGGVILIAIWLQYKKLSL